MIKTISAKEVENIDFSNGIILDVRTKMEHVEKRMGLTHAHAPLDELNPTDFMMRHGLDKDSNVYVLCRSGKRATTATQKFLDEGYKNTFVIEGGIIACEDCGHEIKGYVASQANNSTVKINTSLSLERQVRIAAGMIAATGALLGLLLNPLYSFIPLLVGCGLVFAGITDRCGMALILTKAPWNKIKDTTCPTTPCGTKSTGQSCQ
jgi:rhodanese-related sulfurtransferase